MGGRAARAVAIGYMLIGAIGLIRRRATAWVLAGVMSVSGTVYTLSLAAASITVVRAGLGAGEELPIWISLTLLGAVTATLLLSRMRPTHSRHDLPS